MDIDFPFPKIRLRAREQDSGNISGGHLLYLIERDGTYS
jgi:hypothetical protein